MAGYSLTSNGSLYAQLSTGTSVSSQFLRFFLSISTNPTCTIAVAGHWLVGVAFQSFCSRNRRYPIRLLQVIFLYATCFLHGARCSEISLGESSYCFSTFRDLSLRADNLVPHRRFYLAFLIAFDPPTPQRDWLPSVLVSSPFLLN